MNLKHPGSTVDFKPNPGWFLGPFDVYDREETLGENLAGFNPLDPAQIQHLFDKYFFNHIDEQHGYLIEHKAAIMQCLIDALRQDDYDFGALLPNYSCEKNRFFLPYNWEFPRPRYISEQAYLASVRNWKMELKTYGFIFPDPRILGLGESS